MTELTGETRQLVERGEGYWCYDAPVTDDPEPMVAPEDDMALDELVSFETQRVYRPVNVELNDNGEPYAWFYDTDLDLLGPTDGKRYVRMEQVHLTPPRNADPAYKHDG